MRIQNRKILVLIFVALCSNLINVFAQSCYELVWNDEFNYSGLPDASKWSHEVGNTGWGNNELQFYTDQRLENARVEDSVLIIEARKENYQGAQYTSARLITYNNNLSWKYGKIEARIKLPYGQGIWPAFWMLGNGIFNGTGWPACGETDILELIGGGTDRDNKVYGTIHWSDANGNYARYGGSKTLSSGIFNDDFHVFSIEWDASAIRWFLDGVQYHVVNITATHMTEFHKEFFIIINLAIGGDWPGNPNASTEFSQKMEVDYVRVYQLNTKPEISGDSRVVKRQNGAEFSTVESSEFTYEWTVPDDAEITKGQGTSAIEVNWGCKPGFVKCVLTTKCSSYNLQYLVVLDKLVLTGKTTVRTHEKNIFYLTQKTNGSTYNWTYPEGVSVIGEQDSNQVHLNWGGTSGILKVTVESACGLDSAQLSVSAFSQNPYPNSTQAHKIPGIIESVHYDTGGEGIAYHDYEANNNGTGIRQNEGVDTEYNDGSGNVGWIEPNEWLEYTVAPEATEDNLYDIEIRVASINNGGRFNISFGGEDRTATISVPNTTSWSKFSSIFVPNVKILESDTIMRVNFMNGLFNLGKMIFTKSSESAIGDVSQSKRLLVYPSHATNFIHIKNIRLKSHYQIATISGKQILHGELVEDASILVEKLKPGSYFLIIRNALSPETHRFIKL